MPTPEENMQSVRDFAEEVFGRKNLDYAADWLADDFVEHQVFPGTTPDKKGAIGRSAARSGDRGDTRGDHFVVADPVIPEMLDEVGAACRCVTRLEPGVVGDVLPDRSAR